MTSETIYPLSISRDLSGGVCVGGFSICELAKTFGTPLYIYDAKTVVSQIKEIRQEARHTHKGEVEICYAAKAYLSLEFAKRLNEFKLGIDTVSFGELVIAKLAGFSPEKIHLHGNNKSKEEVVCLAIDENVHAIVIDSLEEIEFIESCAAQRGRVVRIWLRINPGITVETHAYRMTAHPASKFGIPIENGSAAQAIIKAQSSPHLELIGLHIHLGSQIFEYEPYLKAIRVLFNLAAECNFVPQEISPGGGWGVAYIEEDQDYDIHHWFLEITEEINRQCQQRGWKLPKLVIEPGRWLIARAGLAVYTIGTSKETPDGLRILAVDGGMGDNLRPALYKADYTACVAERPDAEALHKVRVVGKFCESGDELIHEIKLPDFQRGDHLIIPVAGAYQLSMVSNYNLAARPTVLWIVDNRIEVLQKKNQAFEDDWWLGR